MIRSFVDGPSQVHNSSIISRFCKIIHSHIHNRKTLEKSYLFKIKGKIIERPQYLFMRVALGIHGEDIKEALKTYDLMSEKYFIHATPTLFNSGTKRQQLSSCFLFHINLVFLLLLLHC